MPKKSPAPERVDARVVDSHCHLQSFEATEREEVLDAARARGVGGFLVPSIELDDRSLLLELSDRHPDVWCSAGCHPNHAETWRRGDAERLADAARDLRIVAIGECGLDFHYDRSPRAHQERVMREQWEVAVDLGLPVIVHNRDSNARMLEIRRRPEFDALRVDFHSFSGGA
ncbi:MAG: TatD family hydrolase, partial [Acidobacteriota bacterium]